MKCEDCEEMKEFNQFSYCEHCEDRKYSYEADECRGDY